MNAKINFAFYIILLMVSSKLNAQNALTASLSNATYNSDCQNGKIDLHINGGHPPYTVSWSKLVGSTYFGISTVSDINGSNDGEDLINISPGKYYVTVTDDLCGEAKANFVIKCECEKCEVQILEKKDSDCDNGGSIKVGLSCLTNQHEPLTYLWSDGNIENSRTDLNPGTYCVTITDAFDCSYSNCILIGGVKPFDAGIAYKANNDDCEHGTCNGAISISTIGGTGNITYNWSNGETTQNIDHLCTGSYSVTISDNVGCQKQFTTEILCCDRLDNDPIRIDQIEIKGAPSGKIVTSVSGGNGDFNIICVWRDQNNRVISYDCRGISNLEPGRYCLTVSDGCTSQVKCFEIVDCNINPVNFSANIKNTCQGYSAGSLNVIVNTGVPPYKYFWSNGQTTNPITNLSSDMYCVTVSDNNGCSQSKCFDILENVNSVRKECNIYCNDVLVKEIGYGNDVYNPLDCREKSIYCKDGMFVRKENVGLKNIDVDKFSCYLEALCFNNQVWYSEFGDDCRDCIFTNRNGSVICCHVDYCFFPVLGISMIKNVDEYNSVTSIQIGEGLCNLEVYNNCLGPDSDPIIDENVNCNNIKVRDGSCALDLDYVSGEFYEGAFGPCHRSGGGEEDNDRALVVKELIRPQKIIETNDFIPSDLYESNNIKFSLNENCSKAYISFKAKNKTNSKISVLDKNLNLIISFNIATIAGINNITLDKFLPIEYLNDFVYIRIDFDDDFMFEKFVIQCNNNSIQDKTSINIYPVPANNFVKLRSSNRSLDRYKIEIFDVVGNLLSTYSLVNLNDEMLIDISSFKEGVYFAKITNISTQNIDLRKFSKISSISSTNQ